MIRWTTERVDASEQHGGLDRVEGDEHHRAGVVEHHCQLVTHHTQLAYDRIRSSSDELDPRSVDESVGKSGMDVVAERRPPVAIGMTASFEPHCRHDLEQDQRCRAGIEADGNEATGNGDYLSAPSRAGASCEESAGAPFCRVEKDAAHGRTFAGLLLEPVPAGAVSGGNLGASKVEPRIRIVDSIHRSEAKGWRVVAARSLREAGTSSPCRRLGEPGECVGSPTSTLVVRRDVRARDLQRQAAAGIAIDKCSRRRTEVRRVS